MRIDKSMVCRVEQNISPPMARAITLPVDDNDGLPIAIYVVASPFGKRVTGEQLIAVAEKIVFEK